MDCSPPGFFFFLTQGWNLHLLLGWWVLYCSATREVPLSMEFSQQEHWSGLLCPPPGDLPNPETERMSPVSPHWQGDSLPPCHLGSLYINIMPFDKRQEEETTQSQQAVTLCSWTQQWGCRNHHSIPNTTSHMRPRTQGLLLSRHLLPAPTAHVCTELSSLLSAFTDSTF